MAFPVVLSVTETTFGTETTAHVANLPATVDAGDLLVALFSGHDTGGGSPTSSVSGWVEELQSADTFVLHSAYVLEADGSEDGGTVDVVTNVTCAGAVYVLRIQAGTWGGTESTAAEAAVANGTGSGADPNPPNLAPSWGALDTLWIVLGHVNDDTTGSVTSVDAAPSGYANLDSFVYTVATVETAEMVAYKTENVAADNPAAFTVTNSGTMFWMGSTIAVQPAAASGGGYLVHEEDGTSRFTLEDSSGFIILEETVAAGTSFPAFRRYAKHLLIR